MRGDALLYLHTYTYNIRLHTQLITSPSTQREQRTKHTAVAADIAIGATTVEALLGHVRGVWLLHEPRRVISALTATETATECVCINVRPYTNPDTSFISVLVCAF